MDGLELRYCDYSLTDDQESVRDAFRDFFTAECPSPRVRAAEPLGHDEKLWGQLTEMGAASMGLPESAGGDGATLVDLTLIAEETGTALAPVPFIEHAAASRALAAAPGAPADLLAAAAAGRRILALAMAPADREARQLVPGGAVARDVIALDGRALVAVHATEPPALVPNQGSTPLAWWDLAGGSRIMPGWPVERGGAGLDPVRLRILEVEMRRSRIPSITRGTTSLVVKAVEKHAVPDLAAEVLPKVAEGTVRFCLGYTEPDGGSDIAAAKVRAVRDGEEWVINGSKIFTTGAQNCQYTFLITRTDPDLPKHKGLTMFLVPLGTPGVQIQGIRTFGNERTNIVYYSDVRISDRYRLGRVNDGWAVLHGPLDEEHSIGREGPEAGLSDLSIGTGFLQTLELALDAAVSWACTPRRDGSRPIDDRMVRYRLGRVAMNLEAGLSTPGPMGRVKGSEALVHGAAELMDLVGVAGLVSEGSPGAEVTGMIEYAHRFAQGTATYGGTLEVFHGIIAQHVLGLPKPSYPGARMLVDRKREAKPALA